MTRRTRKHGYGTAAAAALALLSLAGCGSSPEAGGEGGGGGEATPAARDKGPACVGEAPGEGGVHVLRGGGFKLPGGGGVQYAGATADGTTRTATLRDGATYASGQEQWKVTPGAKVTVSGHGYTVRQLCAHRVVLEPRAAEDRAALAAGPKSLEPRQGAADAPSASPPTPPSWRPPPRASRPRARPSPCSATAGYGASPRACPSRSPTSTRRPEPPASTPTAPVSRSPATRTSGPGTPWSSPGCGSRCRR